MLKDNDSIKLSFISFAKKKIYSQRIISMLISEIVQKEKIERIF